VRQSTRNAKRRKSHFRFALGVVAYVVKTDGRLCLKHLSLLICLTGRNRTVLSRNLLRRSVVQSCRVRFCSPQRILPSQRLEHYGLHCSCYWVSGNLLRISTKLGAWFLFVLYYWKITSILLNTWIDFSFFTRATLASAVLAIERWLSVCLYICLSDTRRYCVKTAKYILKLFRPSAPSF